MDSLPVRRPILRWAGSKRRLLPSLLACVPDTFATYVEPFAGAACLFFALRPQTAILGDINTELIHFYTTVRRFPTEVSARIAKMPETDGFYYRLRDRHKIVDPVDRAARFLYLNRNCFNGVYRTNRSGQFNVPVGTKVGKMPTSTEIATFANALRGVRFVRGDFEASIFLAKRNDFVYIDPPYTLAANRYRGEYGYNSFTDKDLSRFVESVQAASRRGAHVLVSYRYDKRLRKALKGWSLRRVSVRSHVSGFAASRVCTSELLAANYPLPRMK